MVHQDCLSFELVAGYIAGGLDESVESYSKQFAKEFAAPAPLLFRKLSNPDLSPSAGKVKLQRQLSQDDGRPRRSSLASSLTGKTDGERD
ncbi:Microtubule-associated serine/threonine-protein kinase 2 [Acipenser ruthenus]|uniref:Microtubule-associated serine/threonine-protein kinase 2 n=1 Tax=Acipenser ruthenus TaxID=7906 RepID=A0A444UDW5_ACIRT|nr:Microtubule-associated serine/threonine-protein kinase 2 [Acipenser ruthenus]